jgi:hypothetical protein
MTKKITFIKQGTFVAKPWGDKSEIKLPTPKKSSVYIPDWYNKSERWINSDKPIIKNYGANQGIKHCVPFLDAMTSGYMVELWTDIQVERISDSEASVTWLVPPDPVIVRDQGSGALIPRPAGHDQTHYAWVSQYAVKVPKGYSVLLTHPVNRFDLPFTTLTGIVDSDSYFPAGNIPFFLRSDFEGIIKAGTPIAQLFPFKRDSWESKEGNDALVQETLQQSYDSRRILGGFYKKLHWTRKEYK